jgi:hypothetical protein
VTIALSGPLALAVPLGLTILALIAWAIWSRPANPPRLQGYSVRQGWQVDPMALLDRDLKEGRLARGVLMARDRLRLELSERHQLSDADVRRRFYLFRAKPAPEIGRACALVRGLETTYDISIRAEDPQQTDLWSRWRRPAWRARARRRFEEELSEIETLWPRLEASS